MATGNYDPEQASVLTSLWGIVAKLDTQCPILLDLGRLGFWFYWGRERRRVECTGGTSDAEIRRGREILKNSIIAPRHLRKRRESRESRETRETRETRESREIREIREHRETKETRVIQ